MSNNTALAGAVVAGMGIAAGIAYAGFVIGGGGAPNKYAGLGGPDRSGRWGEKEGRGGAESVARTPRVSECTDPVFMLSDTVNLRIEDIRTCVSPIILSDDVAITDLAHETIVAGRKAVSDVLHGRDDRLIVVVGPCSIHDPRAALEYASKLAKVKEEHKKELLIIMRVYFEKPRTAVGWKGLINDPYMDGSYNINRGLRLARQVLMDINDLGLPCGTEFLDTISPQYTADLVSWGAIGARTTESQVHRELASGLSMPIGFKNGTNGDLQIAVDAIKSTQFPHCFMSVTSQGQVAIVKTTGNTEAHIILRGGANGPNYDRSSIEKTMQMLDKAKVLNKIIVDCSHGNSKKIHTNQPIVAADVAAQVAAGNRAICGVMIESNLVAGAQAEPLKNGGQPLVYGQSITDACIDFKSTEKVLVELASAIRQRRVHAVMGNAQEHPFF